MRLTLRAPAWAAFLASDLASYVSGATLDIAPGTVVRGQPDATGRAKLAFTW